MFINILPASIAYQVNMHYICRSIEHQIHDYLLINPTVKEIFSKRLLSARRQTGISQDMLVSLIGGRVGKTAIAKYERGEMMADPEVVKLIARALNRDVEYFFKPFSVEVSSLDFVHGPGTGARKEESLKQEIKAGIESHLELERLLNDLNTFQKPFKDDLIAETEDAEEAAEWLREEWNLGGYGVANVMATLEARHIMVFEVDNDHKFDGCSALANGEIPVIMLQSRNTGSYRKRLTALRELGWLVLQFEEGVSNAEKEKCCEYFAMTMLLPSAVILRELGLYRSGIPVNELVVLSDKYGIPIPYLLKRLLQRHVISRFTYSRITEHLSGNSALPDDCTATRPEYPARFRLMLSQALSENIISRERAAILSGLSPEQFGIQYPAPYMKPRFKLIKPGEADS